MTDPLSMQTVLSRFLPFYQQHHRLSPTQSMVCHRIKVCRTEALGGQQVHCDRCDFTQHRYHSCRNRHCPKCQHRASVRLRGQVFHCSYIYASLTKWRDHSD